MLFQRTWRNEVSKLHNRNTFSPRGNCGSFSILTVSTVTIQWEDTGLISAVLIPEAMLHIPVSLPVLQNYINKFVILGIPLTICVLNTTQRTVQRATLQQRRKLCCLFGTAPSPSFGWFWTKGPSYPAHPLKQNSSLQAGVWPGSAHRRLQAWQPSAPDGLCLSSCPASSSAEKGWEKQNALTTTTFTTGWFSYPLSRCSGLGLGWFGF